MYREYKRVKLTPEDIQGFELKDVPEEVVRERKRNIYKKCIINEVIWCLGILLCNAMMNFGNDTIYIIFGITKFAAMFMLIININRHYKIFKTYDLVKWKVIEVRVLGKYKVETFHENNSNNSYSYHFYPIDAVDINTKYRSKVYITKKQYKNAVVDSIIKVDVEV